MFLNSENLRHQTNFQGLNTAKIINKFNGMENKIILYRTDRHDRTFLKLLCDKVDFEKRMPGLSKYEYERWHEMLELAADEAAKVSNISYIASVENKVCGIISFNKGKKNFQLHCICTWPVEFGKKVKMAGQDLFYQMFRTFREEKSSKIKLDAITNGPFDTATKYKKLGFKPITSYEHKVSMETNKYEVENTLKMLDEIIDYIPEKNQEHVKLIDKLVI